MTSRRRFWTTTLFLAPLLAAATVACSAAPESEEGQSTDAIKCGPELPDWIAGRDQGACAGSWRYRPAVATTIQEPCDVPVATTCPAVLTCEHPEFGAPTGTKDVEDTMVTELNGACEPINSRICRENEEIPPHDKDGCLSSSCFRWVTLQGQSCSRAAESFRSSTIRHVLAGMKFDSPAELTHYVAKLTVNVQATPRVVSLQGTETVTCHVRLTGVPTGFPAKQHEGRCGTGQVPCTGMTPSTCAKDVVKPADAPILSAPGLARSAVPDVMAGSEHAPECTTCDAIAVVDPTRDSVKKIDCLLARHAELATMTGAAAAQARKDVADYLAVFTELYIENVDAERRSAVDAVVSAHPGAGCP